MNTETKIVRDCATCEFARPTRENNLSLHTVLMCRHSPPVMLLVPGPKGVQPAVAFPIVQAGMSCYQYMPRGAMIDNATNVGEIILDPATPSVNEH